LAGTGRDPAAAAALLVEDPDFPEQAGDRGNGARHVVGVPAKLGGRGALETVIGHGYRFAGFGRA
jgi:hypothetical protein